jgi:uncharacterized integral membrane protein
MLICALVFALLTAVFAVSNVEAVRVNFLFMSAELPLILVILGSTLLGGLIVFSFGVVRQYRLQREIKLLRKELAELRGEHTERTEHTDDDKAKDPAESAEPSATRGASSPQLDEAAQHAKGNEAS